MGCLKLTYRSEGLKVAFKNEALLERVREKNAEKAAKNCINYYPFGMQHAQPSSMQIGLTNHYKFNGIERQDDHGLKWDLTQFRPYDPQLGRFTGVDPLAESFVFESPYNFGANNPVLLVDPLGLAPSYNFENKRYENKRGREVSFEQALASNGIDREGSSEESEKQPPGNSTVGSKESHDFLENKIFESMDELSSTYAEEFKELREMEANPEAAIGTINNQKEDLKEMWLIGGLFNNAVSFSPSDKTSRDKLASAIFNLTIQGNQERVTVQYNINANNQITNIIKQTPKNTYFGRGNENHFDFIDKNGNTAIRLIIYDDDAARVFWEENFRKPANQKFKSIYKE